MTKPRRLISASLLAVLSMSAAACATTTTTAAPAPATVSDKDFLKLRSAPRVDDRGSLVQRVADWRGGSVTADLRLCVAPDGSVSNVELNRSSGLPAFDAAVVDGAGSWSYEPFNASDDAPRCQDVAVAYVVQ